MNTIICISVFAALHGAASSRSRLVSRDPFLHNYRGACTLHSTCRDWQYCKKNVRKKALAPRPGYCKSIASCTVEKSIDGNCSRRDASVVSRGVVMDARASESTRWMNALLTELWPRFEHALQDIVQKKVLPLVREYLPYGLSFEVPVLALGTRPPRMGPIRLLKLQGADGDDPEEKLQLMVGVDFRSNVEMSVLVANSMSFGVKDLSFTGNLVVDFTNLLDVLPVIGALKISFYEPPVVDFKFTGLSKVARFPGVANQVRRAIDSAISKAMVLRNIIKVPLGSPEQGVDLKYVNSQMPVGMLRLHVNRGHDLLPMDNTCSNRLVSSLIGVLGCRPTSDPYVVVKVGSQTELSKHEPKTLEPKWNQTFDMVVYSRQQILKLEVWDYDALKFDDLIGRSSLEIFRDVVKGDEGKERWHDLEGPSGVFGGEVSFSAEWHRLTSDTSWAHGGIVSVGVDECILPTSLTSDGIALKATIGEDEKFSDVGSVETGPYVHAAAKTPYLERVVQRLKDEGYDAEDIAEILELSHEEVMKLFQSKYALEAGLRTTIGIHQALFFIQPADASKEALRSQVRVQLVGADKKPLTEPVVLDLWDKLGVTNDFVFPAHLSMVGVLASWGEGSGDLKASCELTLDVRGFAPTESDTQMVLSALG